MIPEGFTLTRVDDQRFEIAIKGTTIRWKTYGTKAEVEKRLEDHADEWRAKYAKMNGAKQGAGSAYRGVASVEARKKRCKAALKSEEKKAKAEKDRAEREAASKLGTPQLVIGVAQTPQPVLEISSENVDALTQILASDRPDDPMEQLRRAVAAVERAKAELGAVCKQISVAA